MQPLRTLRFPGTSEAQAEKVSRRGGGPGQLRFEWKLGAQAASGIGICENFLAVLAPEILHVMVRNFILCKVFCLVEIALKPALRASWRWRQLQDTGSQEQGTAKQTRFGHHGGGEKVVVRISHAWHG